MNSKKRQTQWGARFLSFVAAAAGGLILAAPARGAAAGPILEFRGTFSFSSPDPSDLSGLTWLGGNDWRAVSDKANAAPKLSITINAATGGISTAAFAAVVDTLGAPANDYEGIAYDAARHSYFVSEEATPAIHEYDATTLAQAAAYAAPTEFSAHIRSNRGLESLSLNAAGTRLYTANEEALTIDGSAATPNNGTDVRIVEYSITGNTPGAGVSELHQYVYHVDAVQGSNAETSFPAEQSGLSDIAVLPDGRLLMLERSVYYTSLFGHAYPSFESRIYLVDPAAAAPLGDPAKAITDVANNATPLNKMLLFRGTQFNMEGLAVGPRTDRGISILGISDNQKASTLGLIPNQINAFELIVPEPNGGMLLLLPTGIRLLSRRRRIASAVLDID
jgi:hypothetical protein